MAKWTADSIEDQSGRIAIVTGANSGIGFEAARVLADKGARVILACRSPERGQAATDKIVAAGGDAHFMQLDLGDLESVEAFATAFKSAYDRLDLLINNAGVMVPPRGKTKQGFELQIGINHLGHFALTAQLFELIARTPGARVVNVSSVAHRSGEIDLEDLNYERRKYSDWDVYGQSKLANLLFTLELQRRIDAAGLDAKAVAAHPGWTATNLQKNSGLFERLNPLFAMPGWQGALPTLRAATGDGVNGNDYYGPSGFMEVRGYPQRVGRTKRAEDAEMAAGLWDKSEALTGVRFVVAASRASSVEERAA